MLERLLIKDSPAFSETLICPAIGLNVFSGASGSGKSVLMESILALFGIKDSNALLIEGTLSVNAVLKAQVQNAGILGEEELFLSVNKREKTKYFLNNQGIAKSRVKELFGDFVKYIHSHSTSELSSVGILEVFDLVAERKSPKFSEAKLAFKRDYKDFWAKKAALEKLENDEKNILDLKDLAAFEIERIEALAPKVGEYDELMEAKRELSKKERILEKINDAKVVVEGFSGVLALLESIGKNKPAFEEILGEIESALKDEEERLSAISESDIEAILNRIEALGKLIHKHGSEEAALSFLAAKKRDLEYYENISFNKKALQDELDEAQKKLTAAAAEITHFRRLALGDFAKKLKKYCRLLMLNEPDVALVSEDLTERGSESVSIKLKDSAIATLSAGEFNRLKLSMLCIEMEHSSPSGILILDEIDANLSGSESEGVAKVLNMLSQRYQVFAISHQSHLPLFAEYHFLVQKGEGKSQVVLLNEEARVQEIARMISGTNITPEALSFAKERLKWR